MRNLEGGGPFSSVPDGLYIIGYFALVNSMDIWGNWDPYLY